MADYWKPDALAWVTALEGLHAGVLPSQKLLTISFADETESTGSWALWATICSGDGQHHTFERSIPGRTNEGVRFAATSIAARFAQKG